MSMIIALVKPATVRQHISIGRTIYTASNLSSKNEIRVKDEFKDEVSDQLAGDKKPLRNDPFLKNLFAGKFLFDYLKFPEMRLNESKIHEKSIKTIENEFASADNPLQISKKLNLTSQIIPVEYNGLGYDMFTRTRIIESVGIRYRMAVNLITTNEIITHFLLLNGSDEQKSKYMPRIASGSLATGFCFAEPVGNDFDAKNFTTTVDKEYKLKGKKCSVHLMLENADQSALLLVVTKFIKKTQEYLGVYLVESKREGVKMSRNEQTGLYDIEFDGVQLMKDDELIEPSESVYDTVIGSMDNSRFLYGAMGVGALKSVYKTTLENLISERMFKNAKVSYLNVKDSLAKIESEIYALESMVYLTAGIVDSFEYADVSIESCLTKVFASEVMQRCVSECVQLLSFNYSQKLTGDQLAFIDDLRNINFYFNDRDSLLQRCALTGLIYSRLKYSDKVKKLRNPLQYPAEIIKEIFRNLKIKKMLSKADNPPNYLYLWEKIHPTLNQSANMLERASIQLMTAVELLFTKYGSDITSEHLNLKRLAQIATGVYALNAVLARASRSYSIGLKNCHNEIFLTNVFVYNECRKIDNIFKDIMVAKTGATVDEMAFNIADLAVKEKQVSSTNPLARSY